jgi:GAF domain-containing protein
LPAIARLVDLGRRLCELPTLDAALAALPGACLATMPSAQHVGLTRRRSRERYFTVSSTGETALQTDVAQYACGAGPTIDALGRAAVVRTGDLRCDPRWPTSGPRIAGARGIRSAVSTRLPLDDERLVLAVTLYSGEPEAFDPDAEDRAVLLAWQIAIALRAVRERQRADQLAVALETNRQVAKAIGVLMCALAISDDDAFTMLRVSSQRRHQRLSDIAQEVLRDGTLHVPRSWLDAERAAG